MIDGIRAQNGMARMNDILALSEYLGVSAAYGQFGEHFYLVLKAGRRGDIYHYKLFDPFRGGDNLVEFSSDKIPLKVQATKDLRDARDAALQIYSEKVEESRKGFAGAFRRFIGKEQQERNGYDLRDFLSDSGYDLETWFDKIPDKGEIRQRGSDEESCGYLCLYAAKRANVMDPSKRAKVKVEGFGSLYGFVGWARLKLAELKKEGLA